MSLGGGNFLTQNKVLIGAYINFVSASAATATLSDRGVVAAPMMLDWGPENAIFEVSAEDVMKNSVKLFGYTYSDAALKDIREMFKHAKKVFFYRLNGSGVKASATVGNLTITAKHGGVRGNAFKAVVAANVNEPSKWDVITYLEGNKVDVQLAVSTIADLTNNDYVSFSGTGALTATAGISLSGGTNSAVTGTQYTEFLNQCETIAFNALVCPTTDAPTIGLFVAYTKRRRDLEGVKFQVVVYRQAADYEGVINVENTVKDSGANAAALTYWVAGATAATAINKSNTNKTYDGEYTVDTNYNQSQLVENLKAGKFMFHKVGAEVRVLDDVNSFTSFIPDKGTDFQNNQVIRVLDLIGNDIAVLFNNKYNGKVQNNESGRSSFWGDIVTYYKELEKLQAIEGFKPEEVKVGIGADKKSVTVECPVLPVSAMNKLYMTVMVQ